MAESWIIYWRKKGVQILLSNSKAKPGSREKIEEKEVLSTTYQSFLPLCTFLPAATSLPQAYKPLFIISSKMWKFPHLTEILRCFSLKIRMLRSRRAPRVFPSCSSSLIIQVSSMYFKGIIVILSHFRYALTFWKDTASPRWPTESCDVLDDFTEFILIAAVVESNLSSEGGRVGHNVSGFDGATFDSCNCHSR